MKIKQCSCINRDFMVYSVCINWSIYCVNLFELCVLFSQLGLGPVELIGPHYYPGSMEPIRTKKFIFVHEYMYKCCNTGVIQ